MQLFFIFRTTKGKVSFQAWQHICFIVKNQEQTWSFYINGKRTDLENKVLGQSIFSPEEYMMVMIGKVNIIL